MELIGKLGFMAFLFILLIVIFSVYIFGKVILKTLMLIIKGKLFQSKHMKRLNHLLEKKSTSNLTEKEQYELSEITKSLGNIIDALPTKK